MNPLDPSSTDPGSGTDTPSTEHHSSGSIFRELVSYALVGIVSNVVAFLAYIGLTQVGVSPVLAMTVVYLVALVIAFFGNKRLTFAFKGNDGTAALRFLLAYGVGYMLNLSLLVLFHAVLGFPHQAVMAVNTLIVAAFLFVVQKYFVFPRQIEQAQAPTESGTP